MLFYYNVLLKYKTPVFCMEKDFTDVTLCYIRYYMGLRLNFNFMSLIWHIFCSFI